MKLRVDWERTTQYISRLLEYTCYSKAKFSEYLDYSKRYLQDRLAKHKELSYDILLNLADYLGYRVDELVILEGQDFNLDIFGKCSMTLDEKHEYKGGLKINENSANFYKFYFDTPIRSFEELFLFLPLFTKSSYQLHWEYDRFFWGEESYRHDTKYRFSRFKYLFETLEKGKALDYAVAFRDAIIRKENQNYDENIKLINNESYALEYFNAQKQLPSIWEIGK